MSSQHLYTSKFLAEAKVVSPSDQDRFVAKASLKPLRAMLPPDVNPEESPDLLFFSCNGAVGGMINKNGDGITNETALAIYKTAKLKFVSVEHDRDQVVGAILYPGLSRFGSSEVLTEAEAATLQEPVNMSFAGILWKVINPMIAKYITNMTDGGDSLSVSWEIAFSAYNIAVGSKNLFDAKIITPEDASFGAYDKLLVASGGNGRAPNGDPVFRVISGNPIILGYSVVTAPAAEVKGILPILKAVEPVIPVEATPSLAEVTPEVAAEAAVDGALAKINDALTASVPAPETFSKSLLAAAGVGFSVSPKDLAEGLARVGASAANATESFDALLAAASKDFSQKSQEKNITPANPRVNLNRPNPMDIKTISDIEQNWAEICKMEATASVALIQEAIKKGSEEYVAKIEAEKAIVKTAEEAKASAEKRASELEVTLAEVRKQLEELNQRAVASELAAKYQERMASFDEEFDLDDEDRQIIASDIKELSDEAFEAYAKKCKKLMAGKAKKGVNPFAKKGEEDKEGAKHEKEEKEKEGCASTDIKAAIASVKAEGSTDAAPVNGVQIDQNLYAQMAAAFGASFKLDGKALSAPSK